MSKVTPEQSDPARSGSAGQSENPHRYGPQLAAAIEAKWQDRWEARGVFAAPNPAGELADGFVDLAGREKLYVLDMFPYPSGVGLHVGHPLGYIATDIYARFKRMDGRNVLHAMGYDAFGLPAEQYAVQTGTHPRVRTEQNIANMRRQLRRLGLGHDDRRSVATTDVSFYKWTQWIFLQIYNAWFDVEQNKARPISELIEEFDSGERTPTSKANPMDMPWDVLSDSARRRVVDSYRLAYLEEAPVNWCPALGTVLANEEVTAEGRSERGDFPVYKRPLKQWMMRITAYAQRLLEDLEGVDWPEPVKLMQRNWIGRSEGALVDFSTSTTAGEDRTIRVFTTRPDTLFGATYMVLAPEHPLVDEITPEAWPEGTPGPWTGKFPGAGKLPPKQAVAAYRRFAQSRTDVQRQSDEKDKTGVFTGAYATNPVSGERIPVFIADYVMMGYGSGAIMAVPAHDERDFEFARQFDLPIHDVVYSRIQRYVREFVRLTDNPSVFPQGWFEALADFIGLAVSRQADIEDLPELHRRVRQRRAEDHGETKREPRAGEGVRGSVQTEWLDALRPFEKAPFEELQERFESARIHQQIGEAFTTTGYAVNSELIDGLTTDDAKRVMIQWLEKELKGTHAVTYKLRDWLFSRQRYWGEPFPIVYDSEGAPHALPEEMLPVELPALENFQPESSDDPDAAPRPPLGRAENWATVTLDLGDGEKTYRRELNTMPQWAGSCWYYLRYLDPTNDEAFVDPENERYWMGAGDPQPGGVDLYVGGVEHAVLHLLYARFWHKVLFDLGRVSTPEPFQKLFNQGYIQAFAYRDERGVYVEAEEVADADGHRVGHEPGAKGPFFHDGREVRREYGKMGKSLKNAVAPDEICEQFGADTLRLYEMYLGPLDQSKPWNTDDIVGVHRFLQRLWRNVIDEQTGGLRVTDNPAADPDRRALHRTIAGVREDMNQMRFNTAIAKLIELNNHLTKLVARTGALPREIAEPLVLMLAPLAPHLAEELWERLRQEATTLAYEPYPSADASLLTEDTVEIAVQLKGKVKARIDAPAQADAAELKAFALEHEKVKGLLEGKTVHKVVAVPGRLVNIIAT